MHRSVTARGLSSVLAFALSLGAFGVFAPASAAAAPYSAPLSTAVRQLVVAPESTAPYDRTAQFGGDWTDADRDCQNTRAEVLQSESKVTTSFTTTKRCTVKGGKWVTTWDGRVHTSASTVQIDHTVPVHEAWGSGARGWTKAKRVAFYNDLGDHRTLSAQTSKLNSAKQARGPEQWMPPKNRCGYIGEWVAVKHRWGLKVDSTEKAALTRLANSCPNVTIKVTKA